MEHIEVSGFIKAVEKRAEHLMLFMSDPGLSITEKAICEATVYFLNKIIDEMNVKQPDEHKELPNHP